MKRINISPEEFPPINGESWWVVHPNNGNAIFKAPIGAITLCKEEFRSFKMGIAYTISDNNETNGYITIENSSEVVTMPYYLFARYFDAEAFVKRLDLNEKPRGFTLSEKVFFNDRK